MLITLEIMSAPAKKRKVDLECRVFNPEWRQKYFFVDRFGKAQCLICFQTLAVFKELNVRRHWETEHGKSNFASMSAVVEKRCRSETVRKPPENYLALLKAY